MDASAFELNLSLPADPRFAHTMRDLAAHAAEYASGGGADAAAFGTAVETAARGCLARAVGEVVDVVVRRGGGPLEVLIGCHQRFDIGGARGTDITIEWSREARGMMCRISLRI